MSDRHKPHQGRATNGDHRVKAVDFEDKRSDVDGEELIADDVRLGGAVIDTGPHAGERGERIQRLVDDNRDNTVRAVGDDVR